MIFESLFLCGFRSVLPDGPAWRDWCEVCFEKQQVAAEKNQENVNREAKTGNRIKTRARFVSLAVGDGVVYSKQVNVHSDAVNAEMAQLHVLCIVFSAGRRFARVCARDHGNGSEETGVPDAAAQASTQTRAEKDRVFRGRQELERGELPNDDTSRM